MRPSQWAVRIVNYLSCISVLFAPFYHVLSTDASKGQVLLDGQDIRSLTQRVSLSLDL